MNYEIENPAVEAEKLLEKLSGYQAIVKAAENERDALIAYYQQKILTAQSICDDKIKAVQEPIDYLTDQLRTYAEERVTDKKRSVKLPSATLYMKKQSPKFFFDDLKTANAHDQRLINFVKNNAQEFLKVSYSESVDWASLKKKLTVSDNGDVSFADTGEIVDCLHAQFQPDSFSINFGYNVTEDES